MIEFNTNLEKRVAVMMSTSTTRDIDDDETVPIAWRPGRAIEAAQSQLLVNQVEIRVGLVAFVIARGTLQSCCCCFDFWQRIRYAHKARYALE
jgi:hypothetical protein